MFKKNIRNILLFLFVIFTATYFVYFFKVFIPSKSLAVSGYFFSNESSRHVLKVGILSEKGFRLYSQALKEKDEDLFYDALDLNLASLGFTTSASFSGVSGNKELRVLIQKNIDLMEEFTFDINKKDIAHISRNIDEIGVIVQDIEMFKYNTFLEGIILREEKTYTIIISIIYLSICIVLLIILLLYTLYKNRRLEEDNLKHQKILLTQSKIAALGDIIVNIAHQWRQPLSAITTSVSALKLYVELGKEVSNESIVKCSDDVMNQANYLSKTIDDLREFIKEDSLINTNHTLGEIFEKLKSLMNDSFLKHSVKLIIDIDKNIIAKLNDNILIQSFLNICYNVQDAFMNNSIANENRYLFISSSIKDEKLELVFKDSAGGIDESIIDKIFEPYFTTKHQYLGTGIGLFRTSQIITNHLRGTIEVQNISYVYEKKELKGALFKITLENK